MNQNEPAIEEIRIVEMIRIDCHVDRLERCQTEFIAGTLEDPWRAASKAWSEPLGANHLPAPNFSHFDSIENGVFVAFVPVTLLGLSLRERLGYVAISNIRNEVVPCL
ncbi:hypothetical protein Y032_0763g2145 [Ancylostoma ceylanicum]|uniref:Uncharacterized protein n=1 Tax=Ancylostoma ceylanicum TaxID=53326 RepID=A0A016WDW3_9BILA|nr:hypothetical protein Y032_0763g2145 [Ancylostoma ceylanicum]